MLPHEELVSRRCGLRTCDTLEALQIIADDLTRDTINLYVDVAGGEPVTLHCDQLPSCLVAFDL